MVMAVSAPAFAEAKIKCDETTGATRAELMQRDPNEVFGPGSCGGRGWDPQKAIRPQEGKGAGTRVGGANGFSYGAIQAPESPPGKQKADASVSREAITQGCNFPPRIQIGVPPRVSMGAGSCLDFLNDVFKDKNGNTNSAPPPTGVSPNDPCPAESDSTGAYGVKSPITAGAGVAAPCGGVVPTTATDLTLNANPTHFAAVSGNALWAYRKSGNSFATVLNGVKLPTYLCMKNTNDPNKGLNQNSVDLTPATDQMIAYNAADGFLSIRLSSRATMDGGLNPPFDETKPEKWLVLPLNASGVPQVPKNCDKETDFYKAPAGRRDIQIQPSTESGCEDYGYSATRFNAGTCKAVVGCTDKWVWRCQPDITDYLTAAAPVCPQAAGIPPSACTTSGATTDPSCDIITIKPAGAACADKTQYGVLNRPALYYPTGAAAKFYSISGRSALMAETTADTKLYTQSSTLIFVAPSAPSITLEEGGTLVLKDGSMLMMNPKAILSSGSASVTMSGGGQLLTAGGSLLQSFAANAIYAIPPALATNPLELRVGRSITLPAGYLIPTTPTVGSQPPYMRLPVDPLPQ